MSPDSTIYARLTGIESLLFDKEFEQNFQSPTNKSGVETTVELMLPDGKINFSRRLIKTLQLAKFRATEKQSKYVTANHLLYALLVTHLSSDHYIINEIDLAETITMLDQIKAPGKSGGKSMLQAVLELTIEKAKISPYSYVDFQHLGLALLDYEDPVIEAFLVKAELKKEILRRIFDHCLASNSRIQPQFEAVDVNELY